MMGLNPLHAAAHVAAGFLSLWKSEVASRAAYYLDPTERMDPDAWDGDPDFDIPLCHYCDLPSGHDGPHKDCMCGKCQGADSEPTATQAARDRKLGETSTELVALLRTAGNEWGPLGVAEIAALLAGHHVEPGILVSEVVPAASVTPGGGVAHSAAAPPPGLSFVDYMTPAICDVLACHTPSPATDRDGLVIRCGSRDCFYIARDWQEWREHVAPLIAERIERSQNSRK